MDTGSSDKLGFPLLASWLGIAVLGIISGHLSYQMGVVLNSAVILSVSGVIAAYKRSRPVWACFWVIFAATAVICPFLALTGLVQGTWTVPDFSCIVIECAAWYWLLRLRRVRPAAVPQAAHVVVHHVVHGAIGEHAAPGQVMRDAVPDEVIRGAVPGVVEPPVKRRAIAAAPAPLGRMAEKLKAYARR